MARNSPLDLTLANAFLICFERNWLQNCSSGSKPHQYCYYHDFDFFVLFTLVEHLQHFQNIQSQSHRLQLRMKNKTE